MLITFIVNSLGKGGVAKYIENLSKGLTAKGCRVDILILKKNDTSNSFCKDNRENIRVITYNKRNLITIIRKLNMYIKDNKPDIIITTNHKVDILLPILKTKNTKRLRTIHNMTKNYRDISWVEKVSLRLAPLIYRLNKDMNFIAVSEGVRNDFTSNMKINESNIKVIYNPTIDKSSINKFKDYKKMGSKLPVFKNKSLKILNIGRLINQKNHKLLIDSFYLVNKKVDCELIILGEGKNEQMLKNYITELGIEHKVHFEGFVDNPYLYYLNSDLFVLSSDYEGFGLVLVEAMICGCPVVSTNCPSGPSEVLENGVFGTLVETNNKVELAVAINTSLLNKTNRDLLFRRALDFEINNIAEKYLSFMKNNTSA